MGCHLYWQNVKKELLESLYRYQNLYLPAGYLCHVWEHYLVEHWLEAGQTGVPQTLEYDGVDVLHIVLPGWGGFTDPYSLETHNYTTPGTQGHTQGQRVLGWVLQCYASCYRGTALHNWYSLSDYHTYCMLAAQTNPCRNTFWYLHTHMALLWDIATKFSDRSDHIYLQFIHFETTCVLLKNFVADLLKVKSDLPRVVMPSVRDEACTDPEGTVHQPVDLLTSRGHHSL